MASKHAAGSGGQLEKIVEGQMVKAAKLLEERLDTEIERLDKIKDDDLERLREKRLRQLKEQARQKDEWLANGHGAYTELPEERQFFHECQRSARLVCHFYRDSTFRCGILHRHLRLLAQRHVECRFVRISVDNAPFLTRRLGVRVIPTVCIVKDEKVRDYIVGFDDLGGRDDFSTEMLEWRLAKADAIDFKGDLAAPPDTRRRSHAAAAVAGRRSIRGGDAKNFDGDGDDDDDDDDW